MNDLVSLLACEYSMLVCLLSSLCSVDLMLIINASFQIACHQPMSLYAALIEIFHTGIFLQFVS